MPRPKAAGDLAQIAKDPNLFEAFYREHVEDVQRFVARRVQDPYRAADLTAEVFLAALESAATYRPGNGAPVAWLYGVARNVVAADRRRGVREHRANGRFPEGRVLVDTEDLERLHERIDAEARARLLYEAMGQLPEGERIVLELVALDGLTPREAAKVLRIGAVTARVRLHRARRRLRRQLGRSGPGITEHRLEASS